MNSIHDLLGMVMTDAAEGQSPSLMRRAPKPDDECIVYTLELIQKPDGSLEWVD